MSFRAGCAAGFYCAGLSRSHYVRLIGGVQRSTSRRARTVQQYNRGGSGLCRNSWGKRRFAGGLGSSHLRSLGTYGLSRPGGFAIFAAMRKATSAVTSGTGRGKRRLCLLMGRLYVGLSGAAHKSSWRARITACQHCRAVTQHHKSVRICGGAPFVF